MRVVAAILAAAAAAAAATAPSLDAQRGEFQAVSRTPADTMVNFTLSMPRTNEDKLDKVFWAVNTPGNPEYGKFWSVEKLNALTASAPAVRKQVEAFLARHPNVACKLAATGDAFECRAKASVAERIFKTRLTRFKHPKTGVEIDRTVDAYKFPQGLKGAVDFVSGLTGFPVPHFGRTAPAQALRVKPRKLATKGEADAPDKAGYYDDYTSNPVSSSPYVVPETLSKFYNLAGHAGSASIKQAAAEFAGEAAFSSTDLSSFISNTGVPSFTVEKTIGPFDPSDPQPESTLDVEYLGAVGSGNTNWYWTEANWMYDFTVHALSGSDPLPDVFSMSYGWAESEQCQIAPSSEPCSSGGSSAFVRATNTNFQKMGAAGVTVVAASGDSGAHSKADSSCSSKVVNPVYPAACPYLTAVGATMVSDGTTTGATEPICKSGSSCYTGGSEIVCSTAQGALITSGGGFSLYADRPSYQDAVVTAYLAKSGVTPGAGNFNPSGRAYPDVAALGHNYYIELDGEAQPVDGTSASCPVFAGILALMNAHRVANGGSKLGFANPLLYQIAAANPSAFNDITSGNNYCTEQACCSNGYTAAAGWDATTGLGTPNLDALVSGMDMVDAWHRSVVGGSVRGAKKE